MQKPWPLSIAIAHRGASQRAPENTLSALQLAKKYGAKWVECDVQLTKDHHPVIFHDATLNRTTNGSGKLSDITLSRLRQCDAGSWFSAEFSGERVPTLQEWLQCAAALSLGLNIEIKSNTKKQAIILAETLLKHLQQYWPAHSNRIAISSSDPFVLTQIAERANSLPLGIICKKIITEKEMENLLRANIISVHQPFQLLTQEYVQLLHEKELRVLAYTVNDARIAEQLRSMGVDGFFTDCDALFSL